MVSSAAAGYASIGILIVTLLLGMPVGVCLLTGGFLGLILMTGDISRALGIFATTPYSTTAEFTLTVLPLFILMGSLAYYAGIGESAYDVGQKWLVGLRGGLAIATIFGCAAFGAVCGSSAATAAIFTKLSLPQMQKRGYDRSFACGSIAAGGTLGMLIPPSTLAIVYGILTELPISKLLIAGVGPGILLAIIFSLGISAMVRINPRLVPANMQEEALPWRERLASLKRMGGVVLLAVIVTGGIYSGVSTPTEAAALGSGATLVIFLLGKNRSWANLREALMETGLTSAMVFLILIGALVFSRVLALSGLTAQFISLVKNSAFPPTVILMLFIVMYIIMGCFLDSISMMSITLPTIFPLSVSLGFEPIWFALIVIVAIEIGLLTPPMGLNVYIVKAVAGDSVTLEEVFQGCLWFFFLMITGLVLLVLFPSIVTWLPNAMLGK